MSKSAALMNRLSTMAAVCAVTRERLKKLGVEGPWAAEPNRVEFKAHGFDCLLSRNPSTLAWCGYVAVPDAHPLFGKPMRELEVLDIHGGVTYAEACNGHICHAPEDGQDDAVWWIGFDCAHGGDGVPSFVPLTLVSRVFDGPYRDLNFVRTETESLAKQLECFT